VLLFSGLDWVFKRTVFATLMQIKYTDFERSNYNYWTPWFHSNIRIFSRSKKSSLPRFSYSS